MLQLVDNENALALSCVARLHDPHRIRRPPELLNKQRIICRKQVSDGDEVLNYVSFPLLLLYVSFHIFYHEIFSRQLVVVGEVANELIVAEPLRTQRSATTAVRAKASRAKKHAAKV